MNDVKEIRCKGCGKLLGAFRGFGSIKCSKTECGGLNNFDTEDGTHAFTAGRKSSYLKNRATSSGVTFR